VPKSAQIGDEVILYVATIGFFATAEVASQPKPRPDRKNRYGSEIRGVRLIEPVISLDESRKTLPELSWVKYARSHTTPPG